ncbi:MAG: hypothetical protein WDO72_05240 [Pseudomonadota bacterium]
MRLSRKLIATVGLLAGLGLSAESAFAGCGVNGLSDSYFKPTVYRGDDGGELLRTHFDLFGPFNSVDISGLWKFVFTAHGNTAPNAPSNALPIPDGAVVDAGYATWHDDGTEIMNSGRAPASGSFCMGVWKQTGNDSYRLNHWALSWIPDYQPGQTQSWGALPGGTDEAFKAFGPTNIQEVVSLSDHGNRYTGTFRLTQYVNDGSTKPITETAGAPVAFVILGKITATRINP